jgi:hypothetical protein
MLVATGEVYEGSSFCRVGAEAAYGLDVAGERARRAKMWRTIGPRFDGAMPRRAALAQLEYSLKLREVGSVQRNATTKGCVYSLN